MKTALLALIALALAPAALVAQTPAPAAKGAPLKTLTPKVGDTAPALTIERLASRFAAKEAAMKALGLAGRGVGWRQIEVTASDAGAPELTLHGDAKALAAGAGDLALSLSHEGDFATAVVVTQFPQSPQQ